MTQDPGENRNALPVRPLPDALLAFAAAEIEREQVPGAAIGVLHGGSIFTAGVGVRSIEQPLPVHADTLFQIGSTSKTVTATAAMQLVREGTLDLDAKVRSYLPWFRLQSEPDAARLCVRHLLTHHAGFVGDYFKDTGRGDDALELIVRKMVNSPQVIAVDSAFSYSNAAFFVLGLIVASLRNTSFETLVQQRIFAPLGMTRSFYFPEDCMSYGFAVGHIRTADGPKVARRWHTPRSIAPGGGVISTALDQMRYAALHVGAISAPDVLDAEHIQAMQQPQRAAGGMCAAIGLSWMLDHSGRAGAVPSDRRANAKRVDLDLVSLDLVSLDLVSLDLVKHGGATNGQLSAFELVPSAGFAVTVLTNSDSGRSVRQSITDACQRHFLGYTKPAFDAPSTRVLGVELADYCGEYIATFARLRVQLDPHASTPCLLIEEFASAQRARSGEPAPAPQAPAGLRVLGMDAVVVVSGPHRGEQAEFVRDATGRVAYLRWDGRLARRYTA